MNFISHGTTKGEDENESGPSFDEPSQSAAEESTGGEDSLDNFTTNLNDLARKGQIDPLIGRQAELERTIQVLCRRRKNNPLFVGESGVGKTAIAEGLAWRIEQDDVPEVIKGYTIFSGYRLTPGRYQVPR